MVRPEVIRRRLNRLDEYLSILDKLAEYRWEDFREDPIVSGSAERYLHLAIEAINDMGNHIVADEALGVVNQYKDIPYILCQHKRIDAKQKEIWIRMIGFRNALVHDYTDIDLKIVYDTLQNNREDLRSFRSIFARFL